LKKYVLNYKTWFILIVIVCAVFYFGSEKHFSIFSYLSARLTSQPLSPQSASPLPEPPFQKRMYTPTNRWFKEQTYAEIIPQVSDDELVGLRCFPNHSDSQVSQRTRALYAEVKEWLELRSTISSSDANVGDFKLPSSKNTSSNLWVCETEIGEIWGGYQIDTGQNQPMESYLFTITSENGQFNPLRPIAVIHNKEELYYWNCERPLQLHKSGDFYIECNAGDGLRGDGEIYQLKAVEKTTSVTPTTFRSYQPVRLRYCTAEGEAIFEGDEEVFEFTYQCPSR
jgi:hypothetical protein